MHSQSLIGLLGQLILAMGIVIGLMAFLARLLRRRGMLGVLGGGAKRGPQIELLGRHQFGRSASIAVVRAAGKALVVGITEHSITLLTEADPSVLSIPDEDTRKPEATWTASLGGTRPGPTWKTFFQQVRERTVRR